MRAQSHFPIKKERLGNLSLTGRGDRIRTYYLVLFKHQLDRYSSITIAKCIYKNQTINSPAVILACQLNSSQSTRATKLRHAPQLINFKASEAINCVG